MERRSSIFLLISIFHFPNSAKCVIFHHDLHIFVGHNNNNDSNSSSCITLQLQSPSVSGRRLILCCLRFTTGINPHYSMAKRNTFRLFHPCAIWDTIKEALSSAESPRDADRLEKSPCSEVRARHWHTTKVLIYLKTTCQQSRAAPYTVTDPF